MTPAQRRRLDELVRAALKGEPKTYNGMLLGCMSNLKKQGLVDFDLDLAGLATKAYFRVAPWPTRKGVDLVLGGGLQEELYATLTAPRSITAEDNAKELRRKQRMKSSGGHGR